MGQTTIYVDESKLPYHKRYELLRVPGDIAKEKRRAGIGTQPTKRRRKGVPTYWRYYRRQLNERYRDVDIFETAEDRFRRGVRGTQKTFKGRRKRRGT